MSTQTPRLTADCVRVVFVTCGSCQLQFPDGEQEVASGTIVVLPDGVWCAASPAEYVHTVLLYAKVDFLLSQLRWLPVAHPLMQHLRRSLVHDRRVGLLQVSEEGMRALLPKLIALAALHGRKNGEFAMLARVADLFDNVARVTGRALSAQRPLVSRSAPTPRREVSTVVRLLHERLDHAWNVHELAHAVALSESQLTRLFRQDMGVSPAAFLWNARADRMAEILAATDTTVTQAARMVGWASPSAASRAFKRRYGMSPRMFVTQEPSPKPDGPGPVMTGLRVS